MRIAYGVHGFGRGHATRALAVAQRLARRHHDLLILAGDEAFDALQPHFDSVRIPNIGFHYNSAGRISNSLTILRNIPAFLDLKLTGATVDMVGSVLREFKADLVISDSEIFSLRAAQRLGIARVLLDHFSLLVYCRPRMGLFDRAICRGEALVYRMLFGSPDQVIACGFFDAAPRRAGVSVVGPILREEVHQFQPSNGDHLLAYVSKGCYEYSGRLEQALASTAHPVRIYGSPKEGRDGNLEFRPFSNLGFLQDLASCQAIVATTGNQLISEVLHFGKPILGMPMACLEQRLNGQYIERLGIGMQVAGRSISPTVMCTFLSRWQTFKNRLNEHRPKDGAARAVTAVESILQGLNGGHGGRTGPGKPGATA